MTDAPDRSIGGLPKRGQPRDLSGMLARNRTTEAAPPTAEGAGKSAQAATPAPRAAKKVTARKPAPPKVSAGADAGKTQVTAYMSHEIRNRARAAFKATGHLEGDRNWSAFIEQAVLAETQRREQLYNDGQTYAGDNEPLSPGRTIS